MQMTVTQMIKAAAAMITMTTNTANNISLNFHAVTYMYVIGTTITHCSKLTCAINPAGSEGRLLIFLLSHEVDEPLKSVICDARPMRRQTYD